VPAEGEKTLPETPPVLRAALVFQYSAGAKFVALAYLRGGWAAVNELLAQPPTSTEQVLWPDKYFVDRSPPILVLPGGLDTYQEPEEWTVIEENTLGALTVRILVETFLDATRAAHVASGWEGDRFIAFGKGDELHIYWVSAWDGEAAAREFFAAEQEILARKFPGSATQVEGDRVLATGQDPYWLERRGDKVVVALGVPANEAGKRTAGLWANTTFAPEPVQRNLDRAVGSHAAKNAPPSPVTLPSAASFSR
jgi:hypothetical protein